LPGESVSLFTSRVKVEEWADGYRNLILKRNLETFRPDQSVLIF
jgi:hypothetical protein